MESKTKCAYGGTDMAESAKFCQACGRTTERAPATGTKNIWAAKNLSSSLAVEIEEKYA